MALRFLLIAAACCLAASLFWCSCKGNNRISVFTEYLMEEQRLRQAVVDPEVLEDSIRILRTKYGIEPAREAKRLRNAPEQWLDLFKRLKRGQ